MAKSRAYPLEQLLRLRRELRDHRHKLLATAIAAAEEAEQKANAQRTVVLTAEERLTGLAEEQAQLEQRSIRALRDLSRYSTRLKADLQQKKEELAEAIQIQEDRERDLDGAREALVKAERDVKLVESNREGWDKQKRREAERLAEEELDDLVSARQK